MVRNKSSKRRALPIGAPQKSFSFAQYPPRTRSLTSHKSPLLWGKTDAKRFVRAWAAKPLNYVDLEVLATNVAASDSILGRIRMLQQSPPMLLDFPRDRLFIKKT